MKFHLEPSADGKHKWIGVFADPITKTEHRVPFGSKDYQDFTQHRNPVRRANYLSRHKTRENWRDPQTAGALSRWILWGDSTSLPENVRRFKQRFSLD